MSVFNEPFAAESELPNSRRCEQIFVQPAATRKQMDPFADAIYGAGTDLIETELGVQATNGMLGWLFQVLLEATLHTFGDGDVPFLDIVAYGGYTFVAVSITIVWRTIWSYSLYVVA
ncbi:hypothetical protein Goklo_015196, partial [Gossypium klotzschianum]|nr:hypothetical protein [Gossypium klotzschianum]